MSDQDVASLSESKEPESSGPSGLVRYRPLLLGLLFGAMFMAIAFRKNTWTAVSEQVADVALLPYFAGLASYLVYLLMRTLRWRLLLADVSDRLPFATLFRATVWGTAANAIIPHSGEVLRSVSVRETLATTATRIFGTIASERLFDFATVIVLTASTILLYTDSSGLLTKALTTLGLMGSVVVAGAFVICAQDRYIEIVAGLLAKVLPAKISKPLLWQFRELAAGIQQSLRAPGLVAIVALSFLQWAAVVACIYLSMVATGIEASVLAALIILPLTIAGLTLPTAPAYLGTIQLCFLVALESFDIGSEAALAASFVYLGIVTLPVVLGSLLWFAARSLRRQVSASVSTR